ncbi:TlpA family protein disulfide reductase [Sphingobacterium kitahiroshimense]|uniref:TlpA family protein disulfide reductase n=1 Tax=Sphingobacterium sp. B16(2022) TaxID=2914044 RepID=UPI001438768E|nr:TlpA disulfide reductase family protein [Sphingobacterium sp. B16(2022)]NJI72438.1 TlpA family protein disulfide reductase [Sphingobacterium sp. B16(2022)]
MQKTCNRESYVLYPRKFTVLNLELFFGLQSKTNQKINTLKSSILKIENVGHDYALQEHDQDTISYIKIHWKLALCILLSPMLHAFNLLLCLLKAIKGIAIPYIMTIAVFHSLCLSAQTPRKDSGVNGLATIKPLKIGDTIPEFLWNMPLEVVNHSSGKKTITLNDYRDKKLIILDFWATWCGSCLMSMPKMHELEKQFQDRIAVIPVTQESTEKIKNSKHRFKSITNGHILNDFFPHQSIPYIVIINQYGTIEKTTVPSYLNADVLQNMITGSDYYLPEFQEKLDTTLLTFTFKDRQQHLPTYYSSVMGFTDGFGIDQGHIVDSNKHIQSGFYLNYPLIRMYQTAFVPNFNITLPSRRVFLFDDAASIDFMLPDYNHQKYDLSFEYSVPINWSSLQIHKRLQHDLQDFTGRVASIRKFNVPCLVVRPKIDKEILPAKIKDWHGIVISGYLQTRIPKEIGPSTLGEQNYMRRYKLKGLIHFLNNLSASPHPFFIDESGITYPIDLDLPDNLRDFQELKQCFGKQGLDLILEHRELDMFVLADRIYSDEQLEKMELMLSSFGYTNKKENRHD